MFAHSHTSLAYPVSSSMRSEDSNHGGRDPAGFVKLQRSQLRVHPDTLSEPASSFWPVAGCFRRTTIYLLLMPKSPALTWLHNETEAGNKAVVVDDSPLAQLLHKVSRYSHGHAVV